MPASTPESKAGPTAPPAAAPEAPTAAPEAKPAAKPAVPPGSLRVTSHANLSLGGVILTVDESGVVPDDAETRACAAAGLLSIDE